MAIQDRILEITLRDTLRLDKLTQLFILFIKALLGFQHHISNHKGAHFSSGPNYRFSSVLQTRYLVGTRNNTHHITLYRGVNVINAECHKWCY